MQSITRFFLLSLPLAVLAAFLVGSFAENEAILTIINQFFLIGLITLIVGSCLYVIRSGFFHVFTVGFGKLKALFFRKPKELESDFFQLKRSLPTALVSALLITAGCTVILFSLSLTFFYYYM